MPSHLPIYNRQKEKNPPIGMKSQSALEYMMTYGWAILVIVIVAGVLYSLGIFSPSSSLSTTITDFSNLGTVNAVCLGGTSFTISMGDSTGYPINITQINLTSSSSKTTYSPNILIQPNSIETVTVPSSSLCTSGARYSVSAVISYLEPGQIFPGPYTSTGTVAGTAVSPPSSATSYEPLTITNTQNQGTPSPFQQMINVTSSTPGWADISSSPFGQNVEFFSATGQILDSWLENYTPTHAIWWVKLTSSIPVGSKQTIYMGFASTSTNLFNTNNIGEAPQLSPTYGEYNNIADVMNTGLLYQFYQLNGGGIQSQATVYQAQLTPNSVFAYGSLTATAGPTLYQSALSGSSQDVDGTTYPNVIINYQYGYSGGSAFPNPPISNPQYVIMKAIGFIVVNSPTTIYGLTDDGMGIGYSVTGGALIPWLGGSSTSNNPNNIINSWAGQAATGYSGTITTDGSYRLEIDYTNQGGPGEDAVWSNNSINYYSPSQPPNGVMPSVTFGSVS